MIRDGIPQLVNSVPLRTGAAVHVWFCTFFTFFCFLLSRCFFVSLFCYHGLDFREMSYCENTIIIGASMVTRSTIDTYDPVLHCKWYIISLALSTFEGKIHTCCLWVSIPSRLALLFFFRVYVPWICSWYYLVATTFLFPSMETLFFACFVSTG